MSPQRRPRFGSGEMTILVVIGVLILIAVTGNFARIIDALYGPYTVLIAVIMLVEYLILKGGDRSDIYRRELEAARHKRRDDLLALREMETQIVELRAHLQTLANADNDTDAPERLRGTVSHVQEVSEKILGEIRERI